MIQQIHHTGVVVRDIERALSHYVSCGFVVERRFEVLDEALLGAVVKLGEASIELLQFDDPIKPLAKAVKNHIGFTTTDMEQDLNEFLGRGYTLVSPIQTGTTVKKRCFVRDGDGNLFELLEVD